MMGKCFAGPERSRNKNFTKMDVGPLRKWSLTLVWGMESSESRMIAAHANSSVLAANDTAPLSPVATLNSSELDRTS